MNNLRNEENDSKVKDLILEAFKSKYEIYAWGSFGGRVVKADLEFKTIKFNQKKIILSPKKISRAYLDELIGGIGKINFAIPQMSLLFESEFLSYEDDLTIAFPKYYKFYDRRKSERIDPFFNLSIKFEHNKVRFNKSCNDISIGGMSLVLSKNEVNKFTFGDIIKGLELTFPMKNIKVDAKVSSMIKLNPFSNEENPYGAARLSLTFEGNTSLIKKEILKIINGQKKLVCDID
ncbi:PilZ domain-containing protein [Halobacteriovorax sp. HLS]|uniref:PilZ domain-containing protein n=1 Tax=Halobacteriovorax sp. HLS TaxID=2234000 RepID=UPI000FD7B611|nr:PilZ domain-containing protein [Halobacteriovorax sp. HLS]